MGSNNPYAPSVEEFKGIDEFRYLAIFFEKNSVYTTIPVGTIEYKKFWEEVRLKCLEGMTNSYNITITGQHFFYLNFIQILGRDDKTNKKGAIFPKFVDLDYDWFHMVDYAKKNQKSIVCVKGRRQGYSYKAAAISTHEYTFFKKSRSIIGAFLSDYSEGTMEFVIENCNFINTHTEFRKQRNPDTKQYIMSRYLADIGGIKVWKGYQSSVESITFKDKPTAAVGRSATWLILDEAGVFPNIIEAHGYSEPLIRDGNIYTGSMLMFGSAGSMEGGTQHLYEIFINPAQYNCLEFDDPEKPGHKIGYFSTATRGRWGICQNPESPFFKQPMVDDNGNSNELAAYDDILWERERAKGSLNPAKLHNTITQYPLTYREAFLRTKGTVFSSPELQEWLGKVETDTSLRNSAQPGELVFDDNNKIKWHPNPELLPITEFPLKPDANKEGCITIFEHPEFSQDHIPYGLYIAGCDPYDQDKSQVGSLGSFFVYKRFYQANRSHDIVVAEYTGRPEFADKFYENCRKLCIYYNAKVLYENQLTGMKGYFQEKNSLHYMYEQPQIIKDIVKDSKVQRGYGIHMNRSSNGANGIKDTCEIYLRDWLYTERDDLDGKKILNLHTIKSIPLLKELIAYDRSGNFDRVIAFMLCILQSKELHKIHIQETTPQLLIDLDPFFRKQLFRKNNNQKVKY